ncbi:MAG: guanylate kinase [Chitinophagales bacterium]|nr:guanylate kinase [Chitinophagales bacterium]
MAQEKIVIITAPSGAGKTSITKYLLENYSQLAFSISAATRQPRSGEKNGIDYYFITADDFKKKISENAFAEWEMVYEGKYYGTLKTELERIWKENKIPVLDVDVKGAIHIQQQYPNNTLSLFIQPPSINALRERLESRGTETSESLNTRINKAAYEISFNQLFSKIIINDNLDVACNDAAKVVENFLSQS